ncbi:hypothetical protein KOI35_39235 [Actinoplanes bogorensis]|uniref:Uncharacterized protein n=1 Tax=Paractinoplanes bogorensis TaxID=1610840 RepID=A0ABS5Z1J6_9ACTN|nr:hypothetical protein [Actinoplanes bogorensis]MBU2669562.1 hypothetical protein [Actinoplanes bogorensis]
MERGPLALFGAIVAIGVGPALWMGVQLRAVPDDNPARPPVVSEQGAEKAGQQLGGRGAGERSDDSPATVPRGQILPLTTSPSPSPSTSANTEPTPTPSTSSPAPEPAPTTSRPTTPPTESTTAPTDDPTDETTVPPSDDDTEEPTLPPTPPATDPGDDDPTSQYGGYVAIGR